MSDFGGGQVINVQYRPISQLQPGSTVIQEVIEHYPTSDGHPSPYEGLPGHINRNPFFKSYYDLPADLRTASNPPGDFVVLESQPELRYMLTGPPAQEPTFQPAYGTCMEFQKCRMRITETRCDDLNDSAPAVQLSEFLLFDEDDQVIDTGLAVASCNTWGGCDEGEEAQRVLDGNPYTKFLRRDCEFPTELEVDLGIRCKVFSYAWRTADDHPSRDPISWSFQVFTRHGWATLDQVTMHYVPMKRHTLVGPFRIGSPYDPTIHSYYQEPSPPPLQIQGPAHHFEPPPRNVSAELHQLVHSAFPRDHGWDQYHNVVEELLAAHADPNFSDGRGRSTLLKSCAEGDGYVIHRLIQCGGDVNKQAATGEAALHRLCLMGDDRNLKLVLQERADPNVQDRQGDTPLNLAVAKMDLAAVRLLLQHGALKNIPNKKGQLPIDVWEEEMRIGAARNSEHAGAIRQILVGQVRTPAAA